MIKSKKNGELIQIWLNQYDENFKEEITNVLKIFLEIVDSKEQEEFILNLSKEKGISHTEISYFSLLNLKLKKYVLDIREIVKKNNFSTNDVKELLFVKILCSDFTVRW
jgi:hypothetical protein